MRNAAWVTVGLGAVVSVVACGRSTHESAPEIPGVGGTLGGAGTGGATEPAVGGAVSAGDAGTGAMSSTSGGTGAGNGGAGTGGSAGISSAAGATNTAGESSSAGGIGARGAGAASGTAGGAAAGEGGAVAVAPSCSTEPGCTPLQPGEVVVGVQSSCALVGDGTAKCWGSNGYGQLGTGEQGYENARAAPVVGLSGLKMLASGDYHACALGTDGVVSCWGGLLQDDRPPFAVPGLSDVVMIAAGGSHNCALRRNGTVWCWGHHFDGSVPEPIAVAGITTATFIATGDSHGCAILAEGSVSCWDQSDDTALSASAQGVSDAALLVVSSAFSCALTKQFRVDCWGSGAPSGDAEDVVILTANDRSAFIAQPNTFPQCSGGNHLASRGLAESTNRELVLADITGVSIGAYHGCVVTEDAGTRSAFCWGGNSRGQLGAGGDDSATPVRVSDFP